MRLPYSDPHIATLSNANQCINSVDIEMPACSLSAARSVEQTMDLLLAAGHPRMPGAMFACMYVPSPLQPALQSLDPDLENCEFALITHRPCSFSRFHAYRLPCVVYELILLALLVRRAIQFSRASGHGLGGLPRKSPVASVLIRDSVTYFIVCVLLFVLVCFFERSTD